MVEVSNSAELTPIMLLLAVYSFVWLLLFITSVANWPFRISTGVLFLIAIVHFVVIGSFVGLYLTKSAIDLPYHDTYYVVAHFHYILSFVVFLLGLFIFYLLFGKFSRKRFPRWAGKLQFWTFFIGLNLLFFPQHYAGTQAIPRRYTDLVETGSVWNTLSSVGAYITFGSLIFFVLMLIYTLTRRNPSERHPPIE